MSEIELPEKTPLFFNEGFVFDRERVLFASQMAEFSGSAVARISVIKDYTQETKAQWSYYDVDDAIVSVTGYKKGSARHAFFIGINGIVVSMGVGPVHEEEISDTERYGRLLRIRAVGDTVFACGMTGQILSNEGGRWHGIDDGLLGTPDLDFEDIAGSAPNDLYAVGVGGAIYHYDGKQWKKLDSPTNRPLSNVRCVSKEEVYICGNDGLFFRGNAADGWTSLNEGGADHHFWGLEPYEGRIFLAHSGGLVVYDGKELADVDFGFEKPPDCHRVHSADGILWSIGIDSLAFFDGKQWHSVTCPANV